MRGAAFVTRKKTKSAGTEKGHSIHRRARNQVVDHLSSLCTKTEKGSIMVSAMRGEFRGIWRLVLRMQGMGCLPTPFLHCAFYLPCNLIIILYFPKFN
ncbi:hypothetical protein A7X67_06790 [Clostridium sp. W14A]|nr:hypothetical protein A7X67_06790 [Clostridium sp. W14A]